MRNHEIQLTIHIPMIYYYFLSKSIVYFILYNRFSRARVLIGQLPMFYQRTDNRSDVKTIIYTK